MAEILSGEQRACLAAVAERIFPRTDTPGAVEVGAVDYIEKALADAYADFVPAYRSGLDELDGHCRKVYDNAFASLPAETQDTVLRALEAGDVPTAGGREFFELVRQHTLEGILGDPQYGGNRGMAGWRMVGFPGQQHGYPDAYINKVVDMPPRMEVPGKGEK